MEIRLNKKTLKEWIELYYKKYEGIDAKVSITSQTGSVNYYDDLGCVVTTKVKKKIDLLGTSLEETENLSEKRVEEICRKVLEGTDYELESFSYDSDMKSVTTGYGLGEYTKSVAVFHGALLTVQRKTLTTNMSFQRQKNNFNI